MYHAPSHLRPHDVLGDGLARGERDLVGELRRGQRRAPLCVPDGIRRLERGLCRHAGLSGDQVAHRGQSKGGAVAGDEAQRVAALEPA